MADTGQTQMDKRLQTMTPAGNFGLTQTPPETPPLTLPGLLIAIGEQLDMARGKTNFIEQALSGPQPDPPATEQPGMTGAIDQAAWLLAKARDLANSLVKIAETLA